MTRLGTRHANARPLAACGEGALEFLPVVCQDAAQPPTGLPIAGPDDVAQKAEDRRRGDFADDQSGPSEGRGDIAAG